MQVYPFGVGADLVRDYLILQKLNSFLSQGDGQGEAKPLEIWSPEPRSIAEYK